MAAILNPTPNLIAPVEATHKSMLISYLKKKKKSYCFWDADDADRQIISRHILIFLIKSAQMLTFIDLSARPD